MLGFLMFMYWAYYTTARSRLRGEKNLVQRADRRRRRGGRRSVGSDSDKVGQLVRRTAACGGAAGDSG